VSVSQLPRRFSPREMVGIEYAFLTLEANHEATNPVGRVVLEDSMVACLEIGPRRIVAILPTEHVAWVKPSACAPAPIGQATTRPRTPLSLLPGGTSSERDPAGNTEGTS